MHYPCRTAGVESPSRAAVTRTATGASDSKGHPAGIGTSGGGSRSMPRRTPAGPGQDTRWERTLAGPGPTPEGQKRVTERSTGRSDLWCPKDDIWEPVATCSSPGTTCGGPGTTCSDPGMIRDDRGVRWQPGTRRRPPVDATEAHSVDD